MKTVATTKSASRVGILLLNSHFRPVHYNAEAVTILGYPKKTREPALDPLLALPQLTNISKQAAAPIVPIVMAFTSGRRRYVCRAFHLDVNGALDNRVQPRVVLLLERDVNAMDAADPTRWADEYQLTNRECQTVGLLLKGLTSKEIAAEMSISPNTVKAFLKLAMAKVGASSRASLVARLLWRASILVAGLPTGVNTF